MLNWVRIEAVSPQLALDGGGQAGSTDIAKLSPLGPGQPFTTQVPHLLMQMSLFFPEPSEGLAQVRPSPLKMTPCQAGSYSQTTVIVTPPRLSLE